LYFYLFKFIDVKKLCFALILAGFAGTVCAGLLKTFHIVYSNLFIIADVLFLAGITMLPAVVWNKFSEYLLRQKISLFILWMGLLHISIAHLFRLMHWQSYRYFLALGFTLILFYMAYVFIFDCG